MGSENSPRPFSEPNAAPQRQSAEGTTVATALTEQPAATASSRYTDVESSGAAASRPDGASVVASTTAVAVFTSSSVPTSPSVAAATSNSLGSGDSKGLSNGAVAGVAIGALIVGALLAFLAAFLLFKKRSKQHAQNLPSNYHHNNYSDSTPELVMMQQKNLGRNSPYVQVSQTPIPAPAPVLAPVPASVAAPQPDPITALLPPLASESEIQHRLSNLFGAIHRHVETYYRDVQASITPSMTADLLRFGAEGVDMASLLQDCSSPVVAIKHALTYSVLSLTGPKPDSNEDSIWPEELSSSSSYTTSPSREVLQAQTLQRRLGVYIYTHTYSNPLTSRSNTCLSRPTQTPSSTLRRSYTQLNATIREAAEHFSLTFFPWVNPASDDEAKEDDLAKIIADALECRIWLFGQQGLYEIRWDGVGARGVVVSPEVVVGEREKDDEDRGRVVVEGKVVSI